MENSNPERETSKEGRKSKREPKGLSLVMVIDEKRFEETFPKLYEHWKANRFSDVVLQSWCIVELFSTDAILAAYHLSSQDAKSKPIVALSAFRKLAVLRDASYISDEEYSILNKFRIKRNEIVHKIGGDLFYTDDAEKKDIMENAIESSFVMVQVQARTHHSLQLKVDTEKS